MLECQVGSCYEEDNGHVDIFTISREAKDCRDHSCLHYLHTLHGSTYIFVGLCTLHVCNELVIQCCEQEQAFA